MAHKKKHSGHVPPGNQPKSGPGIAPGQSDQNVPEGAAQGAPFQEQDPKRRLGDFEGAGEHSFQQPGGRNDANH